MQPIVVRECGHMKRSAAIAITLGYAWMMITSGGKRTVCTTYHFSDTRVIPIAALLHQSKGKHI